MSTLRLVLICSLITGVFTACTKEESAELHATPDLEADDPPATAEDSLELLRDALLGDYTGSYHDVFNHYIDASQSYDTTYQLTHHLTPDIVTNGFDVDGSWSIRVRLDSTMHGLDGNGSEYYIGRFRQTSFGMLMEYHISNGLGHADLTRDFAGYQN